MPHINSIRLVNVHFNNATQFYDDFRIDPGGLNTTYDLENGGGKSLLLLMLLQTILPKSYLRKEKPVSLLFQGGKDRTSHVAVEWLLEDGGSYQYLLTGFCARKRRGFAGSVNPETPEEEENIQAADIEHLNWCVFYNDNKITGIRAVPLAAEESGKKTYAGFEEIRKYIQQLKSKGLPAEVFDGIDKYQNYLSTHQLLTAEWNIIKGINSGETNIESYFRQNATSRKLIENQFVKIIEDVETLNRGNKNHDESLLLADTLIEIRNRLNEYLKLKEHMAEFTRIKECYLEFGRKNDEFYQSFSVYEACKQQAAAIRNLIGKRLANLAEKKAEAVNRVDQNTRSSREGARRQKLLQAGLVNYEQEKLLSEAQQREAERKRLAQIQRESEEFLNHLLTLEAYGDYRTVKGRLNQTHTCIQALKSDDDTLEADYRQAGGRFRYVADRLLKTLENSCRKSAETKDELENKARNIREALTEEEKRAAVLKAAINDLFRNETVLGEELKALNDFFLGQGKLEAVLSTDEFVRQSEAELNQYVSETGSNAKKIEAIDNRIRSLELEIVKIEGEIKSNLGFKEQYEGWLNTYQQKLLDMKKQAGDFGKIGLQEYREELELLIHKEGLSKLEKEIQAGRMRQKKQLSEKMGYYVPNEEILALTEHLSAKCEFVKAGIEWLDESKSEDRPSILRELPYLPFSVIVDQASFDKLKNGRLKLDFSSDYPVPVVNLETVRLLKNRAAEDVYYFCSFAGLIVDSGQYAQYVQSIETALKSIDNEITAAETRLTQLNADLLKVVGFFAAYPQEQVNDINEKLAVVEKAIMTLQERQVSFQEEKDRSSKERAVLSGRIEKLTKLMDDCREKINKLNRSIGIGEELAVIREKLGGKNRELDAVTMNIAGAKDDLNKLEQQQRSLNANFDELRLKLHDAQNEKKQLSSFEEIENQLSIDQARADYKALQEAISGKRVEENELRNRLDEYSTRLENLKARILRDYGRDLEQVEKSEADGVLVTIPSEDVIEKAKLDKKENNRKLNTAEKQINEINLKIKNSEGRLEEILKDFPRDQETDLPHYESEIRYRQEIELVEQLMKGYSAALTAAAAELERIRQESEGLNHQAENYEAFMEREAVTGDSGMAEEIKDFRQFEREFHHLLDEIRTQCARWEERIKTIQAETAAFVIREPLEELGRIMQPVSAAQCLERKANFAEYIANIEEQMEKITNDLLKLESYQQDFSRRCIQRAELILGHLRKLESLSRIEVYGRRISMIELKLPEFTDQEKQLRMKAHIDGIVKEIDVEGTIDRKRVAARLSTKELLAQITDLDKAAVRLYKIESIPENSRFYRWEQAVGSEGQNNSLYFIFAACLISFIRMLSITNTSLRTKKVIIADNPFGATSAVYLWDPMFQVMKQNGIQLIAPGHRIPREITSRFGVSYLLNQDILQDGRMRVVVKDVRVEEAEDRLKYIDAEQIALF
jgi:chromosome segregation ATPase